MVQELRNPPFWSINFLVVTVYKVPLFSKDLITFLIFFIPLFVSIISELITDEISLLTFSAIILVTVSKRNFGISFPDLGRSSLFLIKYIAIVYGVASFYNISGDQVKKARKIILTVPSLIVGFLIILYYVINYSKKPYEALKLVYQLVITYAEN